MDKYQRELTPPSGVIDVILDTDAYNEIDDQFALAYLLRSNDKLNTKAIYAAPFHNHRSLGPEDGMLKSYYEILRLLTLCGETKMESSVFKGSTSYLPDEHTPVLSDAAHDLCSRAMDYSPEKPLYVVAIGAITNIASALLLNPRIKERIVVVWLGGHAHHWHNTREFNMHQDYPAARVVMGSGVPFIQLPCRGVVSEFATTEPELKHWLIGKNPLADYLAENAIRYMHEKDVLCKPLWDVTAIGWLLNENNKFMYSRVTPVRLPNDSEQYDEPLAQNMCYVYGIRRDPLLLDLFRKILE